MDTLSDDVTEYILTFLIPASIIKGRSMSLKSISVVRVSKQFKAHVDSFFSKVERKNVIEWIHLERKYNCLNRDYFDAMEMYPTRSWYRNPEGPTRYRVDLAFHLYDPHMIDILMRLMPMSDGLCDLIRIH